MSKFLSYEDPKDMGHRSTVPCNRTKTFYCDPIAARMGQGYPVKTGMDSPNTKILRGN